jgi:hypothetical protein
MDLDIQYMYIVGCILQWVWTWEKVYTSGILVTVYLDSQEDISRTYLGKLQGSLYVYVCFLV